MNIHMIKARDLPDLWFQAVHDILDNGRRFTIDRGSYAGQTRLEYDYFCGHVIHPYTMPLIPDIPPSLGIPNPVEEAYIYGGDGYERSYIEYLMTGHKEPGESYTYGERLTRAPEMMQPPETSESIAWPRASSSSNTIWPSIKLFKNPQGAISLSRQRLSSTMPRAFYAVTVIPINFFTAGYGTTFVVRWKTGVRNPILLESTQNT